MLRPMGKASPPVVGKCRASTRPPSRVYQDSRNLRSCELRTEETHDPWLKKRVQAPKVISTTRHRLKCWAELKRFANVRRCISVLPESLACTTSSGKLQIT